MLIIFVEYLLGIFDLGTSVRFVSKVANTYNM